MELFIIVIVLVYSYARKFLSLVPMVMGWSVVLIRVYCCACGGLDKKVSQVSVGRRDKAPDEICDASLIQCLSGLRRALSEKGHDTNYESGAALHPYRRIIRLKQSWISRHWPFPFLM